jgi:hypothetical protein
LIFGNLDTRKRHILIWLEKNVIPSKDTFRIKKRSIPGVVSVLLCCARLLTNSLLRFNIRAGFGYCAAGMILFAIPPSLGWGQSAESTEAVQSTETINPQYEYNVKAAFLYSFGRYIEWPKDAFEAHSGAFIIGVCGEDPFGQVLEKIAQTKTIQGRRIIIQKMPVIEELRPCHILFVSHSIPLEQQIAIINKMQDKASLVMGEVPGFAERGGGINFYLESGTVRFEINIEAIKQEKLKLDAKLLNLGKKVSGTIGQQQH